MNGAEALVRSLLRGGVDVCFTNPGTSEMHFVAALERIDGMRCVLALFEGVATGAADGYARMAERPACTLLHLGPGLANGLANLHNAQRARSPIVNIIGEHATYFRQSDTPLTADIEGLAKTVSGWMRTTETAADISADCAAAIAASREPPGQIATLVLPADTAWTETNGPVVTPTTNGLRAPDPAAVEAAIELLRSDKSGAIVMTGRVLRADGLELAGKVSAATGIRPYTQIANARTERGAGRVPVNRVPYGVDAAVKKLSDLDYIILVGASEPAPYFAYPGKPTAFAPPDCRIHTLCEPGDDPIAALEEVVNGVGARAVAAPVAERIPTDRPSGPITHETLAYAVAHALPENVIVVDESISSGRGLFPYTYHAPPHDWLQLTGGAIGCGMPVAIGAAIACPDRPVVGLQADGSGMYTLQALWTQAREALNITTVILANRAYAILKGELRNVGANESGKKIRDMMELDRPALDWVSLARGMGADGERVETADALADAIKRGAASEGPYVVEALM